MTAEALLGVGFRNLSTGMFFVSCSYVLSRSATNLAASQRGAERAMNGCLSGVAVLILGFTRPTWHLTLEGAEGEGG